MVHVAEWILETGTNLERMTSSSSVLWADFHRIPLVSIVKDPMEWPWRPICIHETGCWDDDGVAVALGLLESAMVIDDKPNYKWQMTNEKLQSPGD